MPTFVVILDEESPEAWDNIRNNWPAPKHYIHNKHIAYIREDTKLTAEVADTVGIGKDMLGIVYQVVYRSGFTSSSLVEWLEKYT